MPVVFEALPIEYHPLLPLVISYYKGRLIWQDHHLVYQRYFTMLSAGRRNFSTLKLVILRHGQTQDNLAKRWSGWTDAKLTTAGRTDAAECAQLIRKEGLQFDLAYCSYLSRSIDTLHIILEGLQCPNLEVRSRWQLNQKFYGALQGKFKIEVVKEFGQQKVSEWRRSFTVPPPPVSLDDPRHPSHDIKYKDVEPSLLPCGEHSGDVKSRVQTLYDSEIKRQLQLGRRLLIVCHGSVVRSLASIVLGYSMEKASKFNIPNATPLLIELNPSSLQAIEWRLLGDPTKIHHKIKYLQNELKG